MMKRIAGLAGIALVLSAGAANAQRARRNNGAVELGVDAGIMFGLDDPTSTVVSIPVQDFRVGLFVGDRLELEPRLSLNSIHSQGESLTTYTAELGVLFLPSGDRVGNGLYLRPFVGTAGASLSGAGSDNSGYGGVGLGIKIPFADRRLATRLEANYTRGFSNGGSNAIDLLFGLSFFTR
jgi:hypothetical protein